MANQEQLAILMQGGQAWNEWRAKNRDIQIDLFNANLINANLSDADLSFVNLSDAILYAANLSRAILYAANLSRANLSRANLSRATLSDADLSFVDLSRAILERADLSDADLHEANLHEANLHEANLRDADLHSATLSNAKFFNVFLWSTVFGDVDLSTVKGLETGVHFGPSTIGIDTILKSHGKIPEIFLKRAGVPDSIIEAIPSLVGSLKPIDYYSCFISYSGKDEALARRLYADLQSNHVRCWFAPEHLKIGAKLRPSIDESIRLHDKLLLLLSQYSLASQWIEEEVERALARERKEDKVVLFPIRLDQTVMDIEEGWPALIRNTRNIGDFTRWKRHDAYEKAFARLLRDLQAQ